MVDFICNYFSDFTFVKACVLLGTLTGFLVMWFQIKQNILLWYCNIISATLLGIGFFSKEVYAYAFFQVYYVVTSIYGIYCWKKGAQNNNDAMPIVKMRFREWVISLSVIVVLSVLFTLVLKQTSSDLAVQDAVITAISAVATFLLTKKYLQYWCFWIAADLLYVTTIIYSGSEDLYMTLILYVSYIITSVIGLFEWSRKYKKQKGQE